MIRTWPIDSIIGENGAYFVDRNSEGRLSYYYAVPEAERTINWQHLQQLKQAVLNKFPNAHPTADQPFRLTDIAFDINQDHKVKRSEAFKIADQSRILQLKAVQYCIYQEPEQLRLYRL